MGLTESTGSAFGRRAWLMAILLVAVQAALFLWNLNREYRQTLDNGSARLADAARIADENISGRLRAIDLLLRDIGAEVERRGGLSDPGAVSDFMRTRAEAFPEVRTVVVTTATGIVAASTRKDIMGWDIHTRPYYQRVYAAGEVARTFFSPLTHVATGDVEVVFASRALRGRDGSWEGLVSASLEIGMFHGLLAAVRPADPGCTVTLAGVDGRVISRAPEPERFVGGDISGDALFGRHMASGARETLIWPEAATDTAGRIGVARSVADGSYVVIVEQVAGDALAPWMSQLYRHVIGFALLSLAVLVLTALAVRHRVGEVEAREAMSAERQARRETEQRLLRSAELAARVFESSPDGIVITDRRFRILSANPAFLALFRYAMPETRGRNPGFLLSNPADRMPLRQALRALHVHGSWEDEAVAVRKGGDIFPVWLRITADRDAAGRADHYIGIVSDMTEARSAQDRIDYLSRYDILTALPNIRMMRDYFDMATRAPAPKGMALVVGNLDNFKHINDTLGHAAGDELLREIAKRLKGCVAIGTGDVVSRNAGDEFLILLVDAPTQESVNASVYAMRAVVSVPMQLGKQSVSVTASFGISRYPDDGDAFDTLFRKADAALYHAKQAGRNTSRHFLPSMIDHASERLALKNGLRLAIDRDEFALHYQPLVDLASGRIVGGEALLRWQTPEHGSVSPVRFIPIAEETGMIVPIGQWVLRQVCRQGRAWMDGGVGNMRLAVNISVIQLHSPDFVDSLRHVIAESGLPPEWLELELTESVLITEVGRTLDIIAELKRLGIRIAIDDFGTGYSCLAYLQRMKTDKLKIDRSFVAGLGNDAESGAIVTAIIEMARTLRMSTLAEGVETEQQAELLRQYGCKEVQGYFFGRPVPAERFGRLIGLAPDEVEDGSV